MQFDQAENEPRPEQVREYQDRIGEEPDHVAVFGEGHRKEQARERAETGATSEAGGEIKSADVMQQDVIKKAALRPSDRLSPDDLGWIEPRRSDADARRFSDPAFQQPLRPFVGQPDRPLLMQPGRERHVVGVVGEAPMSEQIRQENDERERKSGPQDDARFMAVDPWTLAATPSGRVGSRGCHGRTEGRRSRWAMTENPGQSCPAREVLSPAMRPVGLPARRRG